MKPVRAVSIALLLNTLVAWGAMAQEKTTITTGYRDGFYVSTQDNRFGLKVGSRIDFGYTYGFIDPSDFSVFTLRHAKFYFGGNAFGETVQFFTQAAYEMNLPLKGFGAPNDTFSGTFTMDDYFVRLQWTDFSAKLGRFKTPFARQQMTYSGNLGFVDRTLATEFFSYGRDLGVTFNVDRETFASSIGMFNGGGAMNDFSQTGTQHGSVSQPANLGHTYMFRAVMMPAGPAGYSEGSIGAGDDERFDVGMGFIFDHDRPVDLNGDGIPESTGANFMSASADVVWKKGRISCQSEFFYRNAGGGSGLPSNAIGFYVQPAYFILPNRLELAGRFGYINQDLDASGDQIFEAAASTNYYFSRDHRYKAQLQYSWVGRESPTSSRNDDSYIDLQFQLTI